MYSHHSTKFTLKFSKYIIFKVNDIEIKFNFENRLSLIIFGIDSTLLTEFEERVGPSITSGDDNNGYIMGYGLISKDNIIIDSVALVDGLKHNLLSISQLCDKGIEVRFTKEACVISDKTTWNILLSGNRKGNVCVEDFNLKSYEGMTCLFSKACA